MQLRARCWKMTWSECGWSVPTSYMLALQALQLTKAKVHMVVAQFPSVNHIDMSGELGSRMYSPVSGMSWILYLCSAHLSVWLPFQLLSTGPCLDQQLANGLHDVQRGNTCVLMLSVTQAT